MPRRGDTIAPNESLRFVPDTVKCGDEFYLPVFSSEDQMGDEYRSQSKDVSAELIGERSIRGAPMGTCREVRLRFLMHRIYCRHCHERSMEHIPFQTHAKARLTICQLPEISCVKEV